MRLRGDVCVGGLVVVRCWGVAAGVLFCAVLLFGGGGGGGRCRTPSGG